MNHSQSQMPTVSIIVPVYCMEKHLNRCIDSIIEQTYNDFELILIDDGSTDRSGDICESYAEQDNRVKVYHKLNGGVGSAKNYGIERANGKYLTFIDSDDFISPKYLQLLVDADNNHQIDLIIGGLYYCNEVNCKITSSLNLPDIYISREQFKTKLPHLLDLRGLNYHVAKLYKKSIIENCNIRFTDFKKTGADDTVFNFEFLKYANDIRVISSNIYSYVIYSSSTSHKFAKDKWKRSISLDDNLTSICNEIGILTSNMTLSLDNRIIMSAIWSADSIIRDSGFGLLQIRKELQNISQDTRIKKALSNPQVYVPEYNKLLFENKWFKYYIQQSQIINKIKRKILKFIPNSIYRFIKHK